MRLFVPEGEALCALRFRTTGDDEEMVVTLGVRDDAGGPLTNPATVAQKVADAAVAASSVVGAAATFADTWTWVGVTASIATSTGALVGEHIDNLVGTATDPTTPQNCALLVHKHTGLGGRHGRGRMYFPLFNIDEADIFNNGLIDPAVLPGFQTRLNNFFTQLGVQDLVPVLFHYPILETPITDPPVVLDPEPPSDDIISFIVDGRIATQRRRLRR